MKQTQALIHRALEAARCYDSRSNLVFELEEWLRQADASQSAPAASLGHPGADAVFAELQARRNAGQEEKPHPLWKVLRSCERDLAAANARIAELKAAYDLCVEDAEEEVQAITRQRDTVLDSREGARHRVRGLERDLAAANARIAELEGSERKACRLVREIADERDNTQRRDLERLAAVASARDAANARADAAEREKKTLSDWFDACRTERDQLAQKLEAAEARLKSAGTSLCDTRNFDAMSEALNAALFRADAAERTSKALEQQVAHGLTVRADLRDNATNLVQALRDERNQLTQKLEASERDVQREKDRRVEHTQRNHTFNTALQRAHRDLVLANTRVETAENRCDQLAARVTALESERELSAFCTPAERKVLEAWRDIPDRTLHELERLKQTSALADACAAELANRAAKAKRGGA